MIHKWKERPELFFNNECFTFMCNNMEIGTKDVPIQFIDFMAGNIVTENEGIFKIEDCKLIARPIIDLCLEEEQDWNRELHRSGNDSPESFLYLLSVGVLDENLFLTDDVIWRYDNIDHFLVRDHMGSEYIKKYTRHNNHEQLNPHWVEVKPIYKEEEK